MFLTHSINSYIRYSSYIFRQAPPASLWLPGDRESWQTLSTIPLPTFYFNPLALAILGMSQMTEDDIYRTSTQYRLWSFTRESLASLRSTTNASAADGVRAAIRSQRTGHAGSGTAREGSNQKPSDPSKEVDCLTVEEEQKLVGFYCVKAIQFADFCEFPTNVKVVKTHPTGFLVHSRSY